MFKLLTTTQAAKRRGVSTARIRQYVKDGRLRPVGDGPHHVFREADVDRMLKPWMGRQRVRPSGKIR